MQLLTLTLFGVLFIATVVTTSEPGSVVANPICRSIKDFDENEQDYELFPNLPKTPIEDDNLTLAQFKAIESSEKEPLIVVSSFYVLGDSKEDCRQQYGIYSRMLMKDFPSVQYVAVKCPSPTCDYLNTSTFIAFDFYLDGVHKRKLVDGLNFSEYKSVPKQLYGKLTK